MGRRHNSLLLKRCDPQSSLSKIERPRSPFTKQGSQTLCIVRKQENQVLTLDFFAGWRLRESGERLTRSVIFQTLAIDTLQRPSGTLAVLTAKLRAVAVAEIELRKIAVKVLLAAMLIDALHAALEDAEIALNRVGADDLFAFVAGVFVGAVVHAVMAGEAAFLVHVAIPSGGIGHDGGFAGDVGADDGQKSAHRGAVYMPATGAAVALDEGKDRVAEGNMLAPRDLLRGDFLFADNGFVDFDGLAFAAHGGQRAFAHGLADAMGQEPRGFILNLKDAV